LGLRRLLEAAYSQHWELWQVSDPLIDLGDAPVDRLDLLGVGRRLLKRRLFVDERLL
jgi:hypothetical protein